MNDWAGIRYVFRHKFKSGISQFLLTMIATVVFDLTVAILLGVDVYKRQLKHPADVFHRLRLVIAQPREQTHRLARHDGYQE